MQSNIAIFTNLKLIEKAVKTVKMQIIEWIWIISAAGSAVILGQFCALFVKNNIENC